MLLFLLNSEGLMCFSRSLYCDVTIKNNCCLKALCSRWQWYRRTKCSKVTSGGTWLNYFVKYTSWLLHVCLLFTKVNSKLSNVVDVRRKQLRCCHLRVDCNCGREIEIGKFHASDRESKHTIFC
jgi:hypothetical protein